MPTQQEIADHLDMSQPAANEFLRRPGMENWRDTRLDAIRVSYIRQIREQAAGRATDGNINLATERAHLAKAQRERVEMQNAVTRRELAPVVLLEQVLARAGSKVAGILDAIPGMVRRRVAALSAEDLKLIAGEIAEARNIAAAVRLADLTEGDPDDDEPQAIDA